MNQSMYEQTNKRLEPRNYYDRFSLIESSKLSEVGSIKCKQLVTFTVLSVMLMWSVSLASKKTEID